MGDFEAKKQTAARLNTESYNHIIDGEFPQAKWAAPKRVDGTLDYNSAMTGDDLRDFVNLKLFPHLASFKQTTENHRSISYKIGEIFGEARNKLQSGYALRDVINKVDGLKFLADIQQKDRVDAVLANRSFGGKERAEIQQNSPIKTSEMAYLFLQNFIKILKSGRRCGVVIKNTFLSNADNASIVLCKHLLEQCKLFAVLGLPDGTCIGTGVKAVVLFFQKGKPTDKIWYCQLNVSRNMGKTNPLNEKDLAEFVKMSKS